MPDTKLVCPKCGTDDNLWSDETASIMYPATFSRDADGAVTLDYTGEDYKIIDEGTVYSGDIWCRDCGIQLGEGDLIEAKTEGD
jgi:hypothetical protein